MCQLRINCVLFAYYLRLLYVIKYYELSKITNVSTSTGKIRIAEINDI